MRRNIIIDYINNFKKNLLVEVKPGVSISCTAYPWSEGAVLVFALSKDRLGNDKIKEESHNLREALTTTRLFAPTSENEKPSETRFFYHKNMIILVKSDENSQWSNDAANRDVEQAVNTIRNHGRQS
jgi:hypothetical protein